MALDQRRAARVNSDCAVAGRLHAHTLALPTGATGSAFGIATLPTTGETMRMLRPRPLRRGADNWRTRTISRNVMINNRNATMMSAVRSAGNEASGNCVTMAEGIVVAPEVRSD